MPEYPDIEVYKSSLRRVAGGETLVGLRITSPFVLRTYEPQPTKAVGGRLTDVWSIGKRIVLSIDDNFHFVIHLMIAGRLRWRKPGAGLPGKRGLAAFDFESGTLLFTEEGKKKRASLHVFESREEAIALDRGGIDVIASTADGFADALMRENRTLKRALTDPSIFSGIGNAYSDEILHRSRQSPFKRTSQLDEREVAALRDACIAVLTEWKERLLAEVGDGFPEKVTAFRDEMAVHGRYNLACPVCGAPIQRVVYAENEANYCPGCQTDGRILADRSLSRLLKDDWPKTIEELERVRDEQKSAGRKNPSGR
ncbi:MAG: formamidopyrimidine-DNA glycosylase [Bacteroidetes bacterium]|nr:formamidopyrimidine-DNA glycosylase [Bacteroidota bacterium]